jgi:hypothetical protein
VPADRGERDDDAGAGGRRLGELAELGAFVHREGEAAGLGPGEEFRGARLVLAAHLDRDPDQVGEEREALPAVVGLVEQPVAVPPGARQRVADRAGAEHLLDDALHDAGPGGRREFGEQAERGDPFEGGPLADDAGQRALDVDPGAVGPGPVLLVVPAVVAAHQRLVRVGAERVLGGERFAAGQRAQRGEQYGLAAVPAAAAGLDHADHPAVLEVHDEAAGDAGRDLGVGAEPEDVDAVVAGDGAGAVPGFQLAFRPPPADRGDLAADRRHRAVGEPGAAVPHGFEQPDQREVGAEFVLPFVTELPPGQLARSGQRVDGAAGYDPGLDADAELAVPGPVPAAVSVPADQHVGAGQHPAGGDQQTAPPELGGGLLPRRGQDGDGRLAGQLSQPDLRLASHRRPGGRRCRAGPGARGTPGARRVRRPPAGRRAAR